MNSHIGSWLPLGITLLALCWSVATAISDTSTSAPSGPRIIIRPSTSVVYLEANGPSKVITCRTAGDKPEMFSQLKWSGPNRMDNYEELRMKHTITEETVNSNSWDLELQKPTADDSGAYYCHGTYQTNDVHNASIIIKVVNPIKLDNCHERQFIVKGSTSGRISCRITGDTPRVSLKKDNTRIEDFGGRYKWDNDDGLVINGEVGPSDAGVYQLQITNDVTGERRKHSIDVQVHTAPQINGSQDLGEFSGTEGERAELKCHAHGNPKPLVFWLDPKLRNLTTVGGYHVNPESGTLLIDRVSRIDDHGEFQCFAFNNVDSTSRKISMTVHTRPQIVTFENRTVDEGSEVTFECRSTGEPRPSFSIRRHGINQMPYRIGDGLVRDLSTSAEGGGSNVYVHKLTITANRSQFGAHYCNATNRAGSAEKIGHLLVNHRPDLSYTPSEQFVQQGRRMTVTCHIIAYPEPKVTWFSDGIEISNLDSSIKTDGQTHIVTMSPAQSQQFLFQRFVCKAENKMGSAEHVIIPRVIAKPGPVTIDVVDRSPTTLKLQLTVLNDGGDRIKYFRYKAFGTALDVHNPVYSFRDDRHNETTLEASLNPKAPYTIRNLLPYYRYRLTIRAGNDAGDGEESVVNIETQRQTRPDPPIVIRPISSSGSPSTVVASEYRNGYFLRWNPPELDNGDPVTEYIIIYGKVRSDSFDVPTDDGEERVVRQLNDRPLHAKIGPLDTNQKYKIRLKARNNYGDSDSAQIIVYTPSDRPNMSEFQPETLAWLSSELPTPALIALLAAAIVLLIGIDIIFCVCFQVGVGYMLRHWCCPSKTNSVISDKTYN